ncbi:MAG: carbonic anhydrase [Pseudomonadota bacterium]
MTDWEKLLIKNKSWSADQREQDPNYFENMSQQRKPKFLWIGSADSPVSANEITSTQPGEMIVHKNIGNLVINSDINMLAVLEYAVHHLKVEHVVVCGHYGCAGVKAALSHADFSLINKWLYQIKDVYLRHETELEHIDDMDELTNRLVEINVKEQVYNLMKTGIIQKAWKNMKTPTLHGWVYGIKDGILKDLCIVKPGSKIHDIYRYDLD